MIPAPRRDPLSLEPPALLLHSFCFLQELRREGLTPAGRSLRRREHALRRRLGQRHDECSSDHRATRRAMLTAPANQKKSGRRSNTKGFAERFGELAFTRCVEHDLRGAGVSLAYAEIPEGPKSDSRIR